MRYFLFSLLSRKASANMWWIIIGAVIALIVLIALLAIFVTKSQAVQVGLSECESKSGICVSEAAACPDDTLKSPAFSCPNNGVCCIGFVRD